MLNCFVSPLFFSHKFLPCRATAGQHDTCDCPPPSDFRRRDRALRRVAKYGQPASTGKDEKKKETRPAL